MLVVSGFSNIVPGEVPESELYDPSTGTWSLAAPSLVPRHYATATTLPDGRVLLSGGFTGGGVTNHAEIYDPVANTWTLTGGMSEPRNGHMAVLLDNGRVLVTGGADGARNASSTAELYDPATGSWSPAGNFGEGRENHQLTKLADGRVLLAGGFFSNPTLTFLSSGAIYDPATNGWTLTASMATPRAQMKGALLPDGTVLVPSAINRTGFVTEAERFDPATGTWTPAGNTGVEGNISYGVGLRDGRVLLTADRSTTTPIYDPVLPANDAWSSRYQASVPRSLSTLTLLQDGRVLNAGGSNFSSAEIFTPPTERGSTGGDFGDIDPGDEREQDVTLSNDGGNPLWIDGTDLAGDDADDFAVVADGCTGETLQPDETCVVRIRFTPSQAGPHVAELTVDDNAELSPATTLTGEGRTRPVDPEPPVEPPRVVPENSGLHELPALPLPAPASRALPVATPPRLPAPCARRFVTLAGITAANRSGNRVRLTGAAAGSLAGQTVRLERNGRAIGTTQITADGRIDAMVRAPSGRRAQRTARYRLAVAGVARSGALKATRRVAAHGVERQTDGGARVTGRVGNAGRSLSLTLRSDAVCGPKTSRVAVRTDRNGRFRLTLPAPPAGSPATIHRLWWGTRSVTLPIVVAAGS